MHLLPRLPKVTVKFALLVLVVQGQTVFVFHFAGVPPQPMCSRYFLPEATSRDHHVCAAEVLLLQLAHPEVAPETSTHMPTTFW